jgi:periplasmic copper chaperone A
MRITELRWVLTAIASVALLACSEGGNGNATSHSSAGTDPGTTAPMDTTAAQIVVSSPWSRPTPPVATVGVAYMTITNHGNSAERLVGASSTAAARVEVHETTMENGVMRMRPVADLEIMPHETVTLSPGGMHIMLLDLAAPLIAGERFPLALEFERAGEITVEVTVGDAAASTSHAGQNAQH